jgi:RimJ/RimL family protein N-acetyltransferase
MELAGDCV